MRDTITDTLSSFGIILSTYRLVSYNFFIDWYTPLEDKEERETEDVREWTLCHQYGGT
jgi:hypothetical protein